MRSIRIPQKCSAASIYERSDSTNKSQKLVTVNLDYPINLVIICHEQWENCIEKNCVLEHSNNTKELQAAMMTINDKR